MHTLCLYYFHHCPDMRAHASKLSAHRTDQEGWNLAHIGLTTLTTCYQVQQKVADNALNILGHNVADNTVTLLGQKAAGNTVTPLGKRQLETLSLFCKQCHTSCSLSTHTGPTFQSCASRSTMHKLHTQLLSDYEICLTLQDNQKQQRLCCCISASHNGKPDISCTTHVGRLEKLKSHLMGS